MASGGSRNASLDYLHLSFAAEYSRDFETATGENRQPARRFLSLCYIPPPPVYIHTEPSFQIETPCLVSRVHDIQSLAISLRITSPRASNREILISTTIFFHTYYYISLLFRESESGSFLRKNRKKKSRVNTSHYIISQC